MKKWLWCMFFAVLVLSSVMLPAVSAQIDFRGGLEEIMRNFEDILTPIFEALLDTSSGEYFFAKILLLLLLFIVIFTILKETPFLGDNRGVALLVAAIISVLSIRYLPTDQFVEWIVLPYTTLGTAIAVFFPYVIYLFFVHRSIPGTPARQAAWVVFGVVFGVLWLFKAKGDYTDTIQLINLAGLCAIIVAIVLDRNIHRAFEQWGLSRAMAGIEDEAKSVALQKYREALERYNIDSTSFNRRNLKNARKRLKRLGVRIPS